MYLQSIKRLLNAGEKMLSYLKFNTLSHRLNEIGSMPFLTFFILLASLGTIIVSAHPSIPTQITQSTPIASPQTSLAYRSLPQIHVIIAGKPFILAIAATQHQQETGLMFIHSLPQNRGMIFVFPKPCKPVFWMKNTYIPLDLIYLNASGIITQHYTMAANGNSHLLYPSMHLILYAIELNAGIYQKLGLKIHERVTFPSGFLKSTDSSP